jgi:hypothetical protein
VQQKRKRLPTAFMVKEGGEESTDRQKGGKEDDGFLFLQAQQRAKKQVREGRERDGHRDSQRRNTSLSHNQLVLVEEPAE